MNKQKIIKILDKIIEIAFYVLIAATTFSTTFVELSITVIIFSWAIAKIVKKDFSAPKHLFLAMFVIFVLWNIISFANTKYMHESIRGLIKIIKYGLILTIAMDVFKSVFTLKKAIYFLIIWSVIVSLNGIAQSRLGFDLIRLKTIDTLDYLSRISSSFHHPNDFGVYLVLVIPIFLSFIFSKKNRHAG